MTVCSNMKVLVKSVANKLTISKLKLISEGGDENDFRTIFFKLSNIYRSLKVLIIILRNALFAQKSMPGT